MEPQSETKPVMDREPDFVFLDPKKLKLFKDNSGRLRLTLERDRSYPEVKVVRAFPLSDPDHYLGLLNAKDRVIGLVADPGELDEDSRKAAADAVGGHYFVPVVRRIRSLREEFGAIYFDVDTDRGRREFVAKGIRDEMEDLGEGELLIPDVDGNRYRIADWRRLDGKSRRLLERVV